MYLSPAVRTIRDDPTAGVDAALTIRLEASAGIEDCRTAVAEHGTVAGETRFANLHATVPEPAVAELLDTLPDEVAAVELRTSVADDPGHEG